MRYVVAPGLCLPICLSLALTATSQTPAGTAIALPAGTPLVLAVIRPIWSASAKPGDPLYAQTAFPVAFDNTIAIPAGSYVAGQIDAITRPTRKSKHASLTVHLTQLILANGYTIPLPAGSANVALDIQAVPANDLLLDNGAQFEAMLNSSVTMDATRSAAALPLSIPIKPGQFTSATLCRPTPATPGSSDTVIPGSPGFPGTPDIVIPGIDGAPPTVIPGTPATPGTPASVVPGSPGSPGSACPAAPLVLSSNVPPATAPATAGQTASNHP